MTLCQASSKELMVTQMRIVIAMVKRLMLRVANMELKRKVKDNREKEQGFQ